MRKRERSDFGERLLLARERAKLTQPQLSQAVGMSQSTLAEAENVGSKSQYTVRIALRCGVSPLWLESGDGPMVDRSSWPFTPELREALATVTPTRLVMLENGIRADLGLPAIPLTADLATHEVTAAPAPAKVAPPVIKNSGHVDLTGRKSASNTNVKVPQPGRRGKT